MVFFLSRSAVCETIGGGGPHPGGAVLKEPQNTGVSGPPSGGSAFQNNRANCARIDHRQKLYPIGRQSTTEKWRAEQTVQSAGVRIFSPPTRAVKHLVVIDTTPGS